jgi:uncharacterized membrane protein (DUF485 family)
MNFDTTFNRQQALFSGAVAGKQAIKIKSSITFLRIFFSFSFVFSFASLNFCLFSTTSARGDGQAWGATACALRPDIEWGFFKKYIFLVIFQK